MVAHPGVASSTFYSQHDLGRHPANLPRQTASEVLMFAASVDSAVTTVASAGADDILEVTNLPRVTSAAMYHEQELLPRATGMQDRSLPDPAASRRCCTWQPHQRHGDAWSANLEPIFTRCVAARMPNAIHNPASNPTQETEAQTPGNAIGCKQIVG